MSLKRPSFFWEWCFCGEIGASPWKAPYWSTKQIPQIDSSVLYIALPHCHRSCKPRSAGAIAAVVWRKSDTEFAFALGNKIGGGTGRQKRGVRSRWDDTNRGQGEDVANQNGFLKHSTVKNVTYCSIGRRHIFRPNSLVIIRNNGGTLDTDVIL